VGLKRKQFSWILRRGGFFIFYFRFFKKKYIFVFEIYKNIPGRPADNRSFLKSQALYNIVDNRNTLAQQNALIAKRLDESLVARNKL